MNEPIKFILIFIGVILLGTWLASLSDTLAIIWGIICFVFVAWMVSGGGDGDASGPGSVDR